MTKTFHFSLRLITGLYLLAMCLLGQNIFAQTTTLQLDSTLLTERVVAEDIDVPWEILWGADDYLWVTERKGRVLRIDPKTGDKTIVLDWESDVESGSEPGLLGMALHPDFETVPKVFLVYTYVNGLNFRERLVSFDWDAASQILENETILLDGISAGNIHNGSRLLISPDYKIFMTTGDRGSGNLAQSTSNLNGKVLRINLDGSIPEDNPDPESYIYSFGHRNAQGLAFSPTGKLYSSEHGAQQSDEFNVIEPNRNYGWPEVQGACDTGFENAFCEANDVREPLWEWSPCVAVNDLIYYEHDAIPEWNDKILLAILGGFVQQPSISVLSLDPTGNEVTNAEPLFTNYGRLRDVCMNPHTGAIYFVTNGFSYPSSGPNQIIEYSNLDYEIVGLEEGQLSFVRENIPLDVFPNPTAGAIQWRFDNEKQETHHLQIFDVNGALVKKVKGEEFKLEKGILTSGIYFFKIENLATRAIATGSFVVK